MTKKHFSTRVIHAALPKGDAYGALHMPIYANAAFEFDSAEDIANAFSGKVPEHVYSRISNPTVQHLENKIKEVTGALGVTAVASGMAAISNVFITLCETGDNIISTCRLFGNTFDLFETTLKPFGIKAKFVDVTNTVEVEKAIDTNTKAIFVETITNPQLEVADISQLVDIANKNGIVLIVDTTITPPYLFDAKEFGVHIEVISSTKYMSGGATSIGGIIIDYGSFDWGKIPKFTSHSLKFGPYSFYVALRKSVYRNLGACLSPFNAYLQSLGLETLTLRADKSCENTMLIATWLQKHKNIVSVNYPGLSSSKYYDIAKKQFGNKAGAVLTFNLASKEHCFSFLNHLEVVRRATNLNDNKTLALHPESTIYCDFNNQQKTAMGVPDTMIRLSVGIEDVNDIIADIENALSKTFN